MVDGGEGRSVGYTRRIKGIYSSLRAIMEVLRSHRRSTGKIPESLILASLEKTKMF